MSFIQGLELCIQYITFLFLSFSARTMKVNILTAIVVAVMATATAAPTGSSNLAEVNEALLDQTIEAKVNSMLADEPGTLKCNYITSTLSGSTPQKSSCKVVILCKDQML